MDDPYDLVLGMFALAIAAVMLVAGELYIVMRPDPPQTYTPPPSMVTSSINGYRAPNWASSLVTTTLAIRAVE
jgi:hypothetical protein